MLVPFQEPIQNSVQVNGLVAGSEPYGCAQWQCPRAVEGQQDALGVKSVALRWEHVHVALRWGGRSMFMPKLRRLGWEELGMSLMLRRGGRSGMLR